jgi:hypothetical protein
VSGILHGEGANSVLHGAGNATSNSLRLRTPDLQNALSRTRPCYIHVGTHKTGTTSIQAFLRDNEERFAALGVLIPRAGRGQDAAGHHNLTQQLLGGGGFVAGRGGLDDVADELRRSGQPSACLSSEDFSLLSRSSESLAAVRDAVAAAGFTPTVIVYLRPQISYCVSIYAEIVKNGNLKPFEAYRNEIIEHGSFLWNSSLGPVCRYDVLLERFARVFGERALIVRRYRSGAAPNALLRSFARTVLGSHADLTSFRFPSEKFNPTSSFQNVLRRLSGNIEVMDMRFAPLDLSGMFELARPFYGSNLRVAQRYGVWVPPFELTDFLLALPLRKTFARTASLAKARHALREFGRIGAPERG